MQNEKYIYRWHPTSKRHYATSTTLFPPNVTIRGTLTRNKYGAKQQFAEYDQSAPVGEKEQKYVQQVTESLTGMHEDNHLPRAFGMVLAIHSDAGYLNEDNARSRAGGHHFLSGGRPKPTEQWRNPQRSVHHQSQAVMSPPLKPKWERYTQTPKGVEIQIFRRNGAQTAPHSRPNRQFNSRRHRQLTRATETHESDGHAFSLAPRSCRKPTTIPFLLAPAHCNEGLLDEASFPTHHRQMRHEILSPYKVVMDLRARMKRTKGE
eukprot:CCRYP_008399-RA/>CCRYP_008399-RA protein AED:0.42 eAED:0.42 QI:0/0/0/1/0/0/2/0/262